MKSILIALAAAIAFASAAQAAPRGKAPARPVATRPAASPAIALPLSRTPDYNLYPTRGSGSQGK